jgi:septal ring factor EnvC (AmiA/AmiB activator)
MGWIAQDTYTIGIAHASQTEEIVFAKLKGRTCRQVFPRAIQVSVLLTLTSATLLFAEGVALAVQNKGLATAAVVGLTAVVLPGPRRYLWRHTLGRFRSPAAAQESARLDAESLTKRIEAQNEQLTSVSKQLAAAREEHSKALAALRAVSRNTRTLAADVNASEAKASSLLEELRQLKGREALELRNQVAQKASLLRTQAASVHTMEVTLAREGF